MFKPQEHKSKWGKRNILLKLKTDKHTIEKGGKKEDTDFPFRF